MILESEPGIAEVQSLIANQPVEVALDAIHRESLAYFAATVLSGPPEPPYNGHFLLGPHHEEWDELIRRNSLLCVLAPRDSGKTYFFSVAYAIWQSVRTDGNLGYIFSATQDQASSILEMIKEEFETNPALARYLPKVLGKNWSTKRIRLRNGSEIRARGWGAKVRGGHPYWIVCDDVLNDETAFSESVRKKAIEYFYRALRPMLRKSGQMIVVGTPYHELDLYAVLGKNPVYCTVRFVALNEKTGAPLWPERYSADDLAKIKLEIGSIRFAREYQCVPVSDDMSLFPSYLFVGAPTEQLQLVLGRSRRWWAAHGIQAFFVGVDFALSAEAGADFFVVWTIGIDGVGNRWIVDIHHSKGLSYQRQKSIINSIGVKYRVSLMTLEANQAQRIYGDELIRETALPIMKYTTGAEKHSLEQGLPSLRIMLENKKYRIPRGDTRTVELTDIWVSQMHSFTVEKGKVIALSEHDDVAMASWLCEQGIKKGAFGFTFGDEYKMKPEELKEMEKQLLADPKLAPEEIDPRDEAELGPIEQENKGKPQVKAQPLPDQGPKNVSLVDADAFVGGDVYWRVGR